MEYNRKRLQEYVDELGEVMGAGDISKAKQQAEAVYEILYRLNTDCDIGTSAISSTTRMVETNLEMMCAMISCCETVSHIAYNVFASYVFGLRFRLKYAGGGLVKEDGTFVPIEGMDNVDGGN